MIAGLLAAAVALGIGQLVAGFVAPDASPVVAVGEASIGLTPPPVKSFAISAFGSHDKVVLVSGILAVLAILAAVVGVLAMRRLAYGVAGLAVFTAIGLAAALSRPTADAGWAFPTLIGGVAAAGALRLLVRAAPAPVVTAPKPIAAPDDGGQDTYTPPTVPDTPEPGRPGATRPGAASPFRPVRPVPAYGPERRRFLRVSAAAAGTAVATVGDGDQV